MAAALLRHKAAQAERLLPIGIRSELVADNGEPWMRRPSGRAGDGVAKAHGMDGLTFHTWRHGAASLMLAAGVPDTVALEVMGHADTSMLRHYQEVANMLKRDAAAKMDALLRVSPRVSPRSRSLSGRHGFRPA